VKIIPYAERLHLNELSLMFKDLHDFHAKIKPKEFKLNSLNKVKKHLTNNSLYTHYLYVENETVLGFISFRIHSCKETDLFKSFKFLNIVEIYVKPQYRKQGIATKLIDFAKTLAKKEKCKTMMCTVHEFNCKSFYMFSKNGFNVSNYKMIKEL
jgi:ribosomal protein S18 acetylase RimI-like enzyme